MSNIITYAGPDGTVALYRGEQSDAIEADPHADISRVLFHSALNYITGAEVISGTVTLTAGGYDASGKKIYQVHPHGRGYAPLIFGKVLNLRALNTEGEMLFPLPLVTGPAPFSGTLQIGSSQQEPYGGEYVHKNIQLGANETHITITDVAVLLGTSPGFTPFDTFEYALDYEVAITNFALPV